MLLGFLDNDIRSSPTVWSSSHGARKERIYVATNDEQYLRVPFSQRGPGVAGPVQSGCRWRVIPSWDVLSVDGHSHFFRDGGAAYCHT